MHQITANTPRVLIVSHDPRDEGGVCQYIKLLKSRLHPRTFITRFTNGPRHDEQSRFEKACRLIYDYARFAFLMLRNKFDVVHFNPEMDLRSFPRETMFMILLMLQRRRFLVFFHGWRWDSFATITSRWYLRIWLFGVLSRACRVLVLSGDFRDALIQGGLDPGSIEVVTTMFDGRRLSSDKSHAMRPGAPRVLFVGRLVREKGVYELILALAILKREFPGITLVMAGSGPELSNLRDMAGRCGLTDRIVFAGYVRGRRKARLLAEADVFVLPSYREGLPVALLEAMGAGLPVVTTRTGGIPAVVREPENGLFLNEVSGEDISAKLRNILVDAKYMVNVGARNREKAWRKYESNLVSKTIESAYQSITNKRSDLLR